jgi:imidazolonepropionase-like amidohydrolase
MHSLRVFAVGALLVAMGSASAVFAQAPGGAMLFEGARLIVGDGSAPIENSAFLVERGKITAVGRSGQVTAPAGTARVNLTGKTVIPALNDAHAHIGYQEYSKVTEGIDVSNATSPPDNWHNYTRANLINHLERAAYYGLASIFNTGFDFGDVYWQLRDDTYADKIPDAARFIPAGPGLTASETIKPNNLRQNACGMNTPEQGRKCIADLAAHDVRIAKMWVVRGGGLIGSHEPMAPATYQAVMDEAHRHNMKVIIHIGGEDDVHGLLRAGMDGFAHPNPAPDEETLSLLKERGGRLFMTLTLTAPTGGHAAYLNPPPIMQGTMPPALLRLLQERVRKSSEPAELAKSLKTWEATREKVAKFKATGIRFGTGSDTDDIHLNMTGWAEHVEMEEMVAAGLTPNEVLTAATSTSAEWLGQNDLGKLAVGKTASFVVLNANPLDDIRNTRQITDVYLTGRRVDRDGLKAKWAKAW